MLLRCLFLYQQPQALLEKEGDLREQMDIVVNGVHTLCTTHQELINAKTEQMPSSRKRLLLLLILQDRLATKCAHFTQSLSRLFPLR